MISKKFRVGGKCDLKLPGEEIFWGGTEILEICMGGGTDPGCHYGPKIISGHLAKSK